MVQIRTTGAEKQCCTIMLAYHSWWTEVASLCGI
jgi:hypothetical protein